MSCSIISQRRHSAAAGVQAHAETIHFPDVDTYRAWTQIVDSEAPGLTDRVLTIYGVDGSRDVVFRLNDDGAPLTPDGVDVLRDIARRLGLGSKQRGGHALSSRPVCPWFPPLASVERSPCQ